VSNSDQSRPTAKDHGKAEEKGDNGFLIIIFFFHDLDA
jgi:hypothetical protein